MCDSHRYIYSKCIGKLRVCMCVRQSQVHIQQMYREIEGVHVCATVTGTYTANVYATVTGTYTANV